VLLNIGSDSACHESDLLRRLQRLPFSYYLSSAEVFVDKAPHVSLVALLVVATPHIDLHPAATAVVA